MTNSHFILRIYSTITKEDYKTKKVPQSKETITREGLVIETLPGTNFKIKLDDGKEILAHLSGRMRLNFIRVLIGDRVKVELSPYDETKGRIVYRSK